MRAFAGAGYFQRGGNIALPAGEQHGAGVIAPLRLIEVHCQEMAGVVGKKRVNPKRLFTGQVVIERLFSQWGQLPVLTIATSHLGLAADSRTPFIAAYGRIS